VQRSSNVASGCGMVAPVALPQFRRLEEQHLAAELAEGVDVGIRPWLDAGKSPICSGGA